MEHHRDLACGQEFDACQQESEQACAPRHHSVSSLPRHTRSRIKLLTGIIAALGILGAAYAAFIGLPGVVRIAPVSIVVHSSSALPPEIQALEGQTAPNLFDRDTTTGHVAYADQSIDLALDQANEIRAIKVYGPAPYLLSVQALEGGTWATIPGLGNLKLANLAAGWNTLLPSQLLTTSSLRLVISLAGGNGGGNGKGKGNSASTTSGAIPEIEIWATGEHSLVSGNNLVAAAVGAAQTSGLSQTQMPAQARVYTATPNTAVVGGSLQTFSVSIDRSAARFKRAWLSYEAYGLAHWVSPVRSINGQALQGGAFTFSGDYWTPLAEPINPNWLASGKNTVAFTLPPGLAGNYSVRNVRIVGELDDGNNFIASATTGNATSKTSSETDAPLLIDGDLTTGWTPWNNPHGGNPTLTLYFDKPTQLDTLNLNLVNSLSGTLNVDLMVGGQWQSAGIQTLNGKKLTAGWNAIGGFAAVAADALRITFQSGQGSAGEILEVSATGSGSGGAYVPAINVAFPDAGQFYGRQAYIRGYLTVPDNGSGPATLTVANAQGTQTQAAADGSFGILVAKDDIGYANQTDTEPWQVTLVAKYPDGQKLTQTVQLGQANSAASAHGLLPNMPNPGLLAAIAAGDASIEIPPGALDSPLPIKITPLAQPDLPALDPGMTNVTPSPNRGYRFTPHGTHFKKDVKVTLPFDPKLVPQGLTTADIKTFYFDTQQGHWVELAKYKLDDKKNKLTSLTNHFTDMINATLVVPDHPETASYNATQMKDIKAADPGAGINLIEPPKPNNMGDARLSYPIEIPKGRQGMQPQLAIQYSSGGGNGWLGLGWDLSIPSISIDTRWGVPRYDGANETETYMLGGEMLTPVAHRGLVPRSSNTTTLPSGEVVKIFHTRVEGGFQNIIRHGNGPTAYWWEVVDKNGTHSYYGGDGKAQDPKSILGAPIGVFRWALRKTVDLHGNTVNYSYATVCDTGTGSGLCQTGMPGYQLYIDHIDYTGSSGSTGPYTVSFVRDRNQQNWTRRSDVQIDARGGFKQVTADLLKEIDVSYNGSLVRSYKLNYQAGAFNKTLLQNVVQYGNDGATEFNRHAFTYYDEVRQGGTYNGFMSTPTWGSGADNIGREWLGGLVHADVSALSGSQGDTHNQDEYTGFSPYPIKDISVGNKNGSSTSDSDGLIALVDINGDGLPDKVFDCQAAQNGATQTACAGSHYAYRPNLSGPSSGMNAASYGDVVPLPTLPTINHEHAQTGSGGTEAYFGGSALTNSADSTITQTAYFADVNGDGLVDLVQDGIVYFNSLQNGVPTFNPDSSRTPAPIGAQTAIDANGTLPDFTAARNQLIDKNPLMDAVRRWTAPYSGQVSLTGNVQLIQSTDPARATYKTADGVRLAIQKNGTEIWSTEIDAAGTPGNAPIAINLPSIQVTRGDRLYFRAQSRFDGSYDDVVFDPVITYVNQSASQTDVNGLPVYRYAAADDFVYTGRPLYQRLTNDGTVAITGTFVKSGVTTDDVEIDAYILSDAQLKAYPDLASISASIQPSLHHRFAWNETGTYTPQPKTDDITVSEGQNLLLVVKADSNIDLKQISWAPQLQYVTAFQSKKQPTDGNGKPVNTGIAPGAPISANIAYNLVYDTDFYPGNTLSGPQATWIAPSDGKILVTPSVTVQAAPSLPGGMLSNIYDTSAAFTVKRRVTRLGKQLIVLPTGTTTDPTANSFEISVNAGDELFFDYSSRDQNFGQKVASLSASMHYISPVVTQTVSAPLFLVGNAITSQTWSVPNSGVATVTPQVTFSTPPTAASAVQLYLTRTSGSNGQGASAVYTRSVVIPANVPLDPAQYAFDVPVSAGDTLAVYYTTTDSTLISASPTTSEVIRITPNPQVVADPVAYEVETPALAFPRPYRGWGYIGYNGNRSCDQKKMLGDTSPCVEPPIDESVFVTSSNPSDYNQTDPNAVPSNASMYPAAPDALHQRWIAEDAAWQITQHGMTPTRHGLKYVSMPAPTDYAGGVAVPKISQSHQDTLGAGYYVSVSTVKSDSNALLDFIDLNGDRYPDIVSSQGMAQFTSPLGQFEASHRTGVILGIRASHTEGITLGPGGTLPSKGQDSDSDKEDEEGDSTAKAQSPQFNISGGETTNYNKADLIDMNGDGLPDRVEHHDDGSIWVYINLGYGFEPNAELWGGADLSSGKSDNFSLGEGLGYSDGVRGYSGGPDVSGSWGSSSATLVDMNGDGLPDAVYNANGSLMVLLNNGSGFASGAVAWSGAVEMGKSKSLDLGIGGSVVIPIGPLCLPTPLCYIILNPALSGTQSISHGEDTFEDINGDGYADHLHSSQDGGIDVLLNTTGRTNLLKQVTRPLGATITIQYDRVGNTYAMPQSRWVMSNVSVNDGHPGDGVDVMQNAYQYQNGNYDRYERDFLGFQTATSSQLNADGKTPYRKVIDTYLNGSFYDKGLQIQEQTYDGQGDIYSETLNTYSLRDIANGAELPPDQLDGQSVSYSMNTFFPMLTKAEHHFYEGGQGDKYTWTSQVYDSVGNIITFNDAGDLDEGGGMVTAAITYSQCTDSYVIGTPLSITVQDASGRTLRQRSGTIDCPTGEIRQISQLLADGSAAVTDLGYDGYGNLQSVTGPANVKNQRLRLDYTYDSQVQTFITQVKDSYGYQSSAVYDTTSYAFGGPRSTTDENNNVISYNYDLFGRTTGIQGPYEQGSTNLTLAFAYHPEAATPYATTLHLNKDALGKFLAPIETVTFVDGIKRAIQVKKSGAVDQGNGTSSPMMIVSGHANYDAMGRTIEQRYPVTEPLGQETVFNTSIDDVTATTTEYDVMDRAVKTTLPDGTVTRMEYGFGPDRNGVNQFLTTVTDANGKKKQSYRDMRELITSVAEFNQGRTLWTSYAYDPLKEITKVVDAKGNQTHVTYDNLGRRTSIDNPDTGLTTTVYDLASNPIQKITANLAAAHKAIDYGYDYVRLTHIAYPDNKGNDVTYEYGAPGAPYNQAGRIVKVTDASGTAEMRYGKLGETVWDRKTVASQTQGKSANSPEVYTTQYAYDTFGRLMVLTLPDGEVLTHAYDAGGNLQSITGVEGAQGSNTSTGGMTTPYLQTLLYDKFEQRTYLKLGNGVETHYTYNAQNRRLTNLMSAGQVAGTFQNLNYGYDAVGNILGLQNKVAIPAASSMGGPTAQTFGYDDLYRLTSAKGNYQYAPGKTRNYQLGMQYDDIHNIVGKNQADAITEGGGKPVPQKATTYDWSYVYSGSQPHAPTHIGNRTFSYDLNGNQLGWTNDNNGTRRTILWDEENRISQIDDNGERNFYTYDAAGERTIKVSRQGQTVYINQYYVVRNRSIVSKHIFAGASRIATHMEMGNGNTGAYRGNGGSGGSGGSGGNGAGQGHANNGNAYAYGQDQQHGQSGQDHGNSQTAQADNGNGQSSGNGHGHASQGNGNSGNAGNGNSNGAGSVDTGEASVDTSNLPGNSGAGLENALSNGQGHKYGIYKHLEREGDTVANGEITSASGAGVTTVNGQSSFLYYYHPDHLGSTGFVTDGNGKLYEHMEYFPFGETWVDEHSNTLRTPYLFTGKEYDLETGLYYFGARYYDPRASVWQSADPILGQYLPRAGSSDPSKLAGMGGIFTPFNVSLYIYGHQNPLKLRDPDGKESLNTQIDNAALGCGVFSCMGYAALKAVYNVGTLGFASVHDPMRDAYDEGRATGEEYVKIGIGGGAAVAITSWFTGKWGGEALGAVINRIAASRMASAATQALSQSVRDYLAGSGGRWGSQATRMQNHKIASALEEQGYQITGGAGRASEEYIPKTLSGSTSSTYVDITAVKNGQTLRVQTVDTLADGVTPTQREMDAINRIRAAHPDDALVVIPKE